ncbi:MAG: DNA/RNA non-specific endonuclease [Bacillota bacterium]|nr:DNA/RNA non-specific endonuclease [Bacillota bacterium]
MEICAEITPETIGKGTATSEQARDLAQNLGKNNDDAGHAIGKNLGGLGGATSGNIFPQNLSMNRGEYSQFEQKVVDYINTTGKSVEIKVTPKYTGGSTRPFEIDYTTTIDGVTTTTTFANP